MPDQWGVYANDPSSRFFWGFFSFGAIIGTVIVYAYNVWMVRRDSAPWPGWETAESESS